MTDKNLTEVICVVDRSGSMYPSKDDTIGGFNKFLEDQKALDVDRCNLTYVQFDDHYDVVHECLPIQDVPALTEDTYVPRGCTALLDAVGRTIDEVGKRLAATPEGKRPGSVVMLILTDGAENSSSHYTKDQIKEMINRQEKQYGWNFMFIGANQDAFAEAGALGIRAATTANYDTKYTKAAYSVFSNAIGSYRATHDSADLELEDVVGE